MLYSLFIALVLSIFATTCDAKFLQKNLNEAYSLQLIKEEDIADKELIICSSSAKLVDAETQTDPIELDLVELD